ncbi:hypothetical protein [Parageobacillus thermoglucosidasius]|jgi:hypothetical protein|uniref:Phage protein n=1 Tax=Parageobacillus thermoglucosidasius TaxID=1426 RepID=A0A1B7KP24_PARTM|nr:hypothetical protein [Parageobacillus thermoglucosidasius]OAT71865.1 hypothetical protein A7K69_10670 [Parageobacillus thermoglucosidasius]
MKKYFEYDRNTGEVTYIHYMPFDEKYGLGKTQEELEQTGVLIDDIPPAPTEQAPIGKLYVLKYDDVSKTLSYVLKDRPLTPQEEMQQRIAIIQQALDDLILGGMQ